MIPVIIRLLSLPNMIGIGPINITPPVWTSDVFEVDCNAVPTKIRITPRNMTIIPAVIKIPGFMLPFLKIS